MRQTRTTKQRWKHPIVNKKLVNFVDMDKNQGHMKLGKKKVKIGFWM